MPAKRLYSDEQRAALYALHERGIGSAEISRRAASGELASVARFDIPPSSVRAIVGAIGRERQAHDVDSLEAVLVELGSGDLPGRALAVLRRELERIERIDSRALSVAQVERAAAIGLAAYDLEDKVRKRLARQRRVASVRAPDLDHSARTRELLKRAYRTTAGTDEPAEGA